MSSSFRYTLTKARSLPSSVNRCRRKSEYCAVRPARASPTVWADTSTLSCLPAYCRSGVGIRIFIPLALQMLATAMTILASSSFLIRDLWFTKSRITHCKFLGRQHSYILLYEMLVLLRSALQGEGVSHRRPAFFDVGDDVRAPDPVGLGQVGLRPARRMIGVRVIEAHNLQTALARLALDPHQLPRIYIVAVVGRIETGVRCPQNRFDDAMIAHNPPQHHPAAFVRVRLFPMSANGIQFGLADGEHPDR